MSQACDIFLTAVIVVLGILCVFCVIRSILGPRIVDRIVAVNMIGTMTMMIIAILAVKMKEGFLVDVAIIYAMISFLAVVVFAKVYMGVYREREEKRHQADTAVPEQDGQSESGRVQQTEQMQLRQQMQLKQQMQPGQQMQPEQQMQLRQQMRHRQQMLHGKKGET